MQWDGRVYSKSIKLFRLRTRRALMDVAGSLLLSTGKGGSSNMGSRSLAPRATIFWMPLRGCGSAITVGTGGTSGEGPRPEDGREILEFRRSRIGEENVVGGAV